MEWKKVKTILICVLVLTNLFLAGNLIWQIEKSRVTRAEAMENVLALLHQSGGEFEDSLLKDCEFQPVILQLKRPEEAEKKLAEALTGQKAVFGGGGIIRSKGENGEAVFRSGGLLEIRLKQQTDAADYRELLQKAGFSMRGAERVANQDETRFTQLIGGRRVENAQLLCKTADEEVRINGRWLQETTQVVTGSCQKNYETALALLNWYRQEMPAGELNAVDEVYFAETPEDGVVMLTPAWRVRWGETLVYLSCQTGKVMNYTKE